MAYAIVAWLLVEVAVTVFPMLSLPDWTPTFVTVSLIIGFPVALIFAWAYELTPEGLKRDKDVQHSQPIARRAPGKLDYVFVALVAVILMFIVGEKYIWTKEGSSQVASLPAHSVAVLPFVDMSPEKDQEYFSDGIAEELSNQLAKIRGLNVAGRTSTSAFKGAQDDLRAIGEKLNVTHILEGSIRKSGDHVRITVQLVKAADGYRVWTRTFDGDLSDIFAFQEDAARTVARALSITLGVGDGNFAAGGTRNFEAYDAYLAGISLATQADADNIARAIEQFERAVALDPEYAQAWSALATIYQDAANGHVTERTEELYRKSEAAALRAIAITPGEVTALLAASRYQTRNRNWMQAEEKLIKAFELAPGDYETNLYLGTFLMDMGRPREAIRYFQQAAKAEPLLQSPTGFLGTAYRYVGEFDLALKEYTRGKSLIGDPDFLDELILLHAMGMGDRALMEEYLEKVVNYNRGSRESWPVSRSMQSMLDSPAAARAALQRYYEDPAFDSPLTRGGIATWASYFGDDELALKAYRDLFAAKAVQVRVIWRPIHKQMRRLPGFKDLLQETGLVDYWRTTGNWGDFCRPVGKNDFECELSPLS